MTIATALAEHVAELYDIELYRHNHFVAVHKDCRKLVIGQYEDVVDVTVWLYTPIDHIGKMLHESTYHVSDPKTDIAAELEKITLTYFGSPK